ncbi:MAG TPA: 4-hydroxy-tetrahydrodipicolinate reductase [Polyangiales bacterium]|nr:4-hydroxy-tetrahydrodipicolinate reductase [Polyangiales bacterium]
MTLKVAIHGAAGRMGQTLVRLIHDAPELELAAAVDSAQSPLLGKDAGEVAGVGALGWPITASLESIASADVVIDFSLPSALTGLLEAVQRYSRPLVLATTGLSEAQRKQLDELARHVPLVAEPNYSTGVAVLYHLAQKASELLADFDLEVIEMHHRNKVDAPSGTALGLAAAAARGRDLDARANAIYGREGHPGARTDKEIGVMTLRGGDVIGDHTLILAGPGERLELSHRATNRDLFARGALRAARWLADKAPGRYGMSHVLGLD